MHKKISVYHGGAKPPLKCFIKAKIKYLSHFFSFLDETWQIDYDCWPNDIKFLFDAKCQIDGWRHQNGLNAVFSFQVKLISSERALEEE